MALLTRGRKLEHSFVPVPQCTRVSVRLRSDHRLDLDRFPFARYGRSDHSVLKWNARVLRTGSGQTGHAQGLEPLSSPARVGQSAGIWRVVAGKRTRAPLTFTLNLPEPVFFGRANGMRP